MHVVADDRQLMITYRISMKYAQKVQQTVQR